MKKIIFTLLFVAFILPISALTSEKSLQLRQGIPCFVNKIQKEKSATIVYYGGNLTRVKGYCNETSEWLKSYYSDSKLSIINASGNFGSTIAAFQLAGDVLSKNPDLVFIEFAAADVNVDTATIRNATEGIVRQIKKSNPKTEICFIYTLNKQFEKELSSGKLHRSVAIMEKVADYYGIPSIDFGHDVEALIKGEQLIFQPEKDKTYEGKIVFNPATGGGSVYSDTFKEAFQKMTKQTKESNTKLPAPLSPSNYELAKTLSFESIKKTGEWKSLDFTNPTFAPLARSMSNINYTKSSTATISFRFMGTSILVYDLLGPTTCAEVQIQIDDNKPVVKKRFDGYCNAYRSSYFSISDLSYADHTVTIQMVDKQIDKIALVGKKPVTESEIAPFNEPSAFYLTKLLIVGELK